MKKLIVVLGVFCFVLALGCADKSVIENPTSTSFGTSVPNVQASGGQIDIVINASIGVPDTGDTYRAYDGDISTDTYTTPSFNSQFPSYLEFGFAEARVNRIGIYKDDYVGAHDLTIQYTTDTGSLNSRTWTTVTGLANGFHRKELLNATSVNSNGTVIGDLHNSPGGDGWASLTFDTVSATGLRIAFSGSAACCNHYHVFEFQAQCARAVARGQC